MQAKIRIIIIIFFISIAFLTTKVQADNKDITQNFEDENLRTCILELVKTVTKNQNKTQIYESDIDKIVDIVGGNSLKLAGKGIKSLKGMEVFANKHITWIFLDWNEIDDLTPLKDLKTLEKISFSGNKVHDLSPLEGLTNLESIIASDNEIDTLETIENLPNVKNICMDGNNIKKIDSIANWNNLLSMSFEKNKIEELPNLENLKHLKYMNVSGNLIQTINDIPVIETLEELEIDDNKIISLDGIQNLINLKRLSCSNNQIMEISEIENLDKLECFNINNNQIQNIDKLKGNAQIKFLYVNNNMVSNLQAIEHCESLKKCSVYNEKISVEIKERIVGDYIWVPLPEIYYQLNNKNSRIFQNGISTTAIGTENFEIDSNNRNVKIKSNVTIQVSKGTYTFLTYTMQADKIAPVIEGVINNKTYIEESVTPVCDDDDVGDVQLTKNGLKVVYNLGDTIRDNGKYILRISDKAGNQATAQFEIRDEIIESNTYKIDGQYITGITSNTDYNNFKKLLKTEGNYNIYRENQKLSDNQIIVTGDKLTTQYGNNFYLVVKGDITKDGYANISDLVRLRKYILKIDQFSELEKKAADLSGDKKADIQDLVYIRQTIINK